MKTFIGIDVRGIICFKLSLILCMQVELHLVLISVFLHELYESRLLKLRKIPNQRETVLQRLNPRQTQLPGRV